MESAGGACSGEDKERQPCQIRTNVCEPLPGTKSILYKQVPGTGTFKYLYMLMKNENISINAGNNFDFFIEHVGSTYLVVRDSGVVGSYVDIEMAKTTMKGINSGSRLIAEVNSANILQRTYVAVVYDVGGQQQTQSQGFNKFWWDWPDIMRLLDIAQKYLDNKPPGI